MLTRTKKLVGFFIYKKPRSATKQKRGYPSLEQSLHHET